MVCPEGWYPSELGYCYQFNYIKKGWVDARDECEDEGGQLAVLDTEEKLQDITAVYGKLNNAMSLALAVTQLIIAKQAKSII